MPFPLGLALFRKVAYNNGSNEVHFSGLSELFLQPPLWLCGGGPEIEGSFSCCGRPNFAAKQNFT